MVCYVFVLCYDGFGRGDKQPVQLEAINAFCSGLIGVGSWFESDVLLCCLHCTHLHISLHTQLSSVEPHKTPHMLRQQSQHGH